MKAVVVFEAGDTDKLIYTDIDKPKLKEGWSLVKVKAFGINRSEIFTRKGYSPSVTFPRILGIECVGVIEESKTFEVGTKVVSIMGEMGRAFDGSYAEYVLLPDEQIYPIESRLPWEDRILVRGASSAAGLAFCNLVKSHSPNIKIYASTQNITKKDILLANGFDDIILDDNYILKTDESFDKILELIGPRSIKDSLRHLNRFGIICSAGQLGEKWFLEDFDPIMELKNDVYLTTFYSGNVDYERIKELFDFIDENKVVVKPNKVFKLSEIKEAHEYLDSKNGIGKVVCVA